MSDEHVILKTDNVNDDMERFIKALMADVERHIEEQELLLNPLYAALAQHTSGQVRMEIHFEVRE